MATKPQYPEQQRPHLHPRLPTPPKRRIPWPLIAIIIVAAILAALIWWLPQTPKKQLPPNAAEVPAQPTGNQIQLTNLKMTPSTVGGAFYVEGMLYNNGNSNISGVQVQATFHGVNGQVLQTQTRPVEGMVGNSATEAQNLTQAPIKPNESRAVRVYFDHYPAGWNKQMPDLKVTTVTAHAP
ncbi:MAG TPA: DUF2393 family protein [Terriglobales bacterium]|nr:DUF2393 family protein [Terriglobales bacterium]